MGKAHKAEVQAQFIIRMNGADRSVPWLCYVPATDANHAAQLLESALSDFTEKMSGPHKPKEVRA